MKDFFADQRSGPGCGRLRTETGKGKILVGTDVTDNYLVLVGGDADKFTANEKTIDEIWGSFGMYSGGASGNS
jgi:hypothetical protein